MVVTDGRHLLLGHATHTPRWDIPKGMPEPDEPHDDAAARELREETGLLADPTVLLPLGLHRYIPAKDLVLFAWRPATMPDPAALRCTSMVTRPGQAPFPELDRFAVLPWDDALARVSPNLARVLAAVRGDATA